MRKEQILIVEDDPDIGDLLVSSATSAGYSLLHTGNGYAVAAAMRRPPDIMLLDGAYRALRASRSARLRRALHIEGPANPVRTVRTEGCSLDLVPERSAAG